jgi:hypothetical protein
MPQLEPAASGADEPAERLRQARLPVLEQTRRGGSLGTEVTYEWRLRHARKRRAGGPARGGENDPIPRCLKRCSAGATFMYQ